MEKRDTAYRMPLFVVTVVLGASLVWAVYDEAVGRRPWKEIQRQFVDMEVGMVERELEQAREALASPKARELQERYDQLREDLEKARGTSEYRELVVLLGQEEEELARTQQEHQFAKSFADEAYYAYQHAFDAGRDHASEKAAWEKLHTVAADLESSLKEAKRRRDEVRSRLDGYEKELREVEEEVDKLGRHVSRAQERLDGLRRKSPAIRQVVVHDFEKNGFDEPVLKVDRCLSCHMAADRRGFEGLAQPFRTHPQFELFIEKHSPERFACTVCHDGQGTGLSFYDAGHTARDERQAQEWRDAYGWKPITHWERPMLPGDFVEASCKRCHRLEEDLAGAQVLSKGVNLFRETLGCVNCHLVRGYEDVNKVGPDLASVGGKVDAAWLFQWVKDPRSHHPKTRMPNFLLSDREAAATTAYLKSLTGDGRWAVREFDEALLGNQKLAATGRDLVRALGCNGCHTVGDVEVYRGSRRDMAPDLTNIAAKTSARWIFNWILDPTAYLADPLMPSLRLSEREAEAIVVYLVSLRKGAPEMPPGLDGTLDDEEQRVAGRKIIADYGCYGCHDIPGTEKLSRVGAELTNFGSKELYELAFGYARDVEKSWLGFTRAKMQTPRIFETEMVVQKMPDFRLSEEELHALAVLLRGFRDESIPKEFTKDVAPAYAEIQQGRKLIKKYNCTGCHEVEAGWGRDNVMVPLREEHDEIEAINYAPPALMGEGRKVQSQWLYQFLYAPSPIRPWVKVRMPTFSLSEEQVDSMVSYFQAVSAQGVRYHFWRQGEASQDEKKEMKGLFDLLQCLKCHELPAGGKPGVAAAELAPSLSLTKDRLNPKWVEDWLRNPQELQPGTKMPNFFLDIDEDGEVTELLPDPEEKIRLLLGYLFSAE